MSEPAEKSYIILECELPPHKELPWRLQLVVETLFIVAVSVYGASMNKHAFYNHVERQASPTTAQSVAYTSLKTSDLQAQLVVQAITPPDELFQIGKYKVRLVSTLVQIMISKHLNTVIGGGIETLEPI